MNDAGLYTNTNGRADFVTNAISNLSSEPCNVYIAVAFFTEADVVRGLVRRGCPVG